MLENINYPLDLQKKNYQEKIKIAEEIRQLIIQTVSKTGGHLASNLGVVELTIALCSIFNFPKDKIVWDVGHQTYVYKILTGRKEKINTLRQQGGIAGFPKTTESEYDCFNTGHSSTSISLALGLARARDLKQETNNIVAVIGDGALTGGMALEALNDAGCSKTKLIVILNDNEMSISKNVGGMTTLLSKLRTKKFYTRTNLKIKNAFNRVPIIGKSTVRLVQKVKRGVKQLLIPKMFFEDIGFTYLGPVDGHDIEKVESILKTSKNIDNPVLIHVITKKGKGYLPAEQKPEKFHSTSSFEISTGEKLNQGIKDYSAILGEKLIQLAKKDNKIIAITAAMKEGTGLEEFAKQFPKRFFDVGIAEQHALGLAAGFAKAGLKPFIPIYSSFLQRAYDQINHDLARMDLSCLICVDRCGFVGADGPTHHGVFDLGILNQLPNVIICAPNDSANTKRFINTYLKNNDHPYILRIPRGEIENNEIEEDEILPIGKWQIDITNDYDVTVISYGRNVTRINEYFKDKDIKIRLVNALYIKPMDTQMLQEIVDDKPLVVYETDLKINSLASNIAYYYSQNKILKNIYSFGVDDHYSTQGTIDEILKDEGLDMDSFYQRIKEIINEERTN